MKATFQIRTVLGALAAVGVATAVLPVHDALAFAAAGHGNGISGGAVGGVSGGAVGGASGGNATHGSDGHGAEVAPLAAAVAGPPVFIIPDNPPPRHRRTIAAPRPEDGRSHCMVRHYVDEDGNFIVKPCRVPQVF